jgi:hypothetical protein
VRISRIHFALLQDMQYNVQSALSRRRMMTYGRLCSLTVALQPSSCSTPSTGNLTNVSGTCRSFRPSGVVCAAKDSK